MKWFKWHKYNVTLRNEGLGEHLAKGVDNCSEKNLAFTKNVLHNADYTSKFNKYCRVESKDKNSVCR